MDTDLTNVILFGVENEYSIHVFDKQGGQASAAAVEHIVRSSLAERLGNHALPFLESRGGYAVENGGRIYWDRIGSISAAECATPEVRSPLEACQYVLAGHRFYRELADDLQAARRASAVEVCLSGVCLQTGHANGIHLNYYRSVDEPIERLVPHLASLPSICGAGGWALRPYACLQFVRSQRAELIAQVSGSDSSHARSLVDSYHKPYCRRGRRVQDLSADATHSMSPLYVRLGSTALLLAMVDLWDLRLGHLSPADPVAAMKIWNCDPNQKLQVAGGARYSALDVQRCLLELVRRQIDRPRGRVPQWSDDLAAMWDKLIHAAADEDCDDRVSLGWAMHESLLKYLCVRHDFDWLKLPTIAQVYVRLKALQGNLSPESDVWNLGHGPVGQPELEEIKAVLQAAAIKWDEFERATRWLQPILHLASTELLEVGRGASTCFEAEMRRRLPALTEESIAAARSIPPQDTRAKVRGAFVSKFAGTAGGAGWDALSHPDGSRFELPDPFDFDVEV